MVLVNFIAHGFQNKGSQTVIFIPGYISSYYESNLFKVDKKELKQGLKEYVLDVLSTTEIPVSQMKLILTWIVVRGDKSRQRSFHIPFSKILTY